MLEYPQSTAKRGNNGHEFNGKLQRARIVSSRWGTELNRARSIMPRGYKLVLPVKDISQVGGFKMSEPTIAQKSPYPVELEAGKSYFWCACGRSAKQPFCDGSHKGSDFTPVNYEATESKTVYFCGCKHSAQKPLCDGSHKKL